MKMKTELNMNNNKIINLSEGTSDADAVNKLQLDSVSYYAKDHTYRAIFGKDFYDLVETSRFSLSPTASGVVIQGVEPSLFSGNNRYVNNYDRIHGLQMNNGYINLTNKVNQSTSYTIFLSLYLTTDFELHFSSSSAAANGYYPRFSINTTTNNLVIHESSSLTYITAYTSDFNNKQEMLWITRDGQNNIYKFSISNYSAHVQQTFQPPLNFETKILRILYTGYVKKIGFVDRFININSLEHHKIMLQERRNWSYFI